MAGRFVTIDGRVVFIGGPSAGAGGSHGSSHVLTGSAPGEGFIDREKVASFLHNPDRSADAERVKDQVVSDIAELSGESYEDVNDFVSQWAKSSNDDDMRSLALQRDAAEEFGIPLSDFTQKKIDVIEEQRRKVAGTMAGNMSSDNIDAFIDKNLPSSAPLLPSGQQRRILRAMYDNTQAKLLGAGFKHDETIRLYRGVKLEVELGEYLPGSELSPISNVLSSWSSNVLLAERFAKHRGPGAGILLSMDVPIEMIMGSARSGFGCLKESEFVLLGVPSIAKVLPIDARR